MKTGSIIKGKQLEERGLIKPTPQFIKRDNLWLRIWVDKENKEYVVWEKDAFAELIREETDGTKVDPRLVENKIEEKKVIPEKKAEIEKPQEVALGTTKKIVLKPSSEIVKNAGRTAKILRDVVEKCKLYNDIAGKKYVRVEGWETLGALLYCKAVVTEIEEYRTGYRATAEIRNFEDKVLSRGVAICLRDEKNWKDKDDYALMSMAQTRAVGKAYRLGFSWILSLAGYEPTPAEEMV